VGCGIDAIVERDGRTRRRREGFLFRRRVYGRKVGGGHWRLESRRRIRRGPWSLFGLCGLLCRLHPLILLLTMEVHFDGVHRLRRPLIVSNAARDLLPSR
jgi:hypothetical protein